MEIEDGNRGKPPNRDKSYGRVSLIFAVAGLLWFVICFTAKEARWWNSLWLFLLIFLSSVSLGIIGRNSIAGIIGIIVGGSSLLVVGTLLFG
jgi:hypothetical protein